MGNVFNVKQVSKLQLQGNLVSKYPKFFLAQIDTMEHLEIVFLSQIHVMDLAKIRELAHLVSLVTYYLG